MPIQRFRPTYEYDQERLEQLKQAVSEAAPEVMAAGKINWETLQEILAPYLEEGEDEGEQVPESVRRATAETATYRNRFAAALADAVLVAYAGPGSKTEALAHEVLAWGKPLHTIESPHNQALLRMGALPLPE